MAIHGLIDGSPIRRANARQITPMIALVTAGATRRLIFSQLDLQPAFPDD
jgi:hypothetical protein